MGKRPFEYIAFWQFLAFIMLVCLIWVNETLDLASVIYRAKPSEFDWIGTSILTACVIIVGFITIAHTYHQQKLAIKGILKICSYCKKVQLDEEAWQRIDAFIADKTRAEFTHGVCPECYHKVVERDASDEPFVAPGQTDAGYPPPKDD